MLASRARGERAAASCTHGQSARAPGGSDRHEGFRSDAGAVSNPAAALRRGDRCLLSQAQGASLWRLPDRDRGRVLDADRRAARGADRLAQQRRAARARRGPAPTPADRGRSSVRGHRSRARARERRDALSALRAGLYRAHDPATPAGRGPGRRAPGSRTSADVRSILVQTPCWTRARK